MRVLSAITVFIFITGLLFSIPSHNVKHLDTRIEFLTNGAVKTTETVTFSEPVDGVSRYKPYQFTIGERKGFLSPLAPSLFFPDFHVLQYGFNAGKDQIQVKSDKGWNMVTVTSSTPKNEFSYSYHEFGNILYFKNHREWSLDIGGNGSGARFETVSFSILLPKGINSSGITIVKISNEIVSGNVESHLEGDVLSGKTSGSLEPGESVRIILNLPENLFLNQDFKLLAFYFAYNNLWLIFPLLSGFIAFVIWFILGRDKKVKILHTRDVPLSLNPMEAACLMREIPDGLGLTAIVASWASKGIVHITAIPKSEAAPLGDYEIKKTNELPADTPDFEKDFFKVFFGKGNTVLAWQMQSGFQYKSLPIYAAFKEWINSKNYFVKNSRGRGIAMGVLTSLIFIAQVLTANLGGFGIYFYISAFFSGAFFLLAAYYMPKKTEAGLIPYQQIHSFADFIKKAYKKQFPGFVPDLKEFGTGFSYALSSGQLDKYMEIYSPALTSAPEWFDMAPEASQTPDGVKLSILGCFISLELFFNSRPYYNNKNG